jgi:hypothetical protein
MDVEVLRGLPHEEDNRYITDIQIKSVRKRYKKNRDINQIPMIENIFPLFNRLSMRGLRMGIDV